LFAIASLIHAAQLAEPAFVLTISALKVLVLNAEIRNGNKKHRERKSPFFSFKKEEKQFLKISAFILIF